MFKLKEGEQSVAYTMCSSSRNVNIPTPLKTTLCTTHDYTYGFAPIGIDRHLYNEFLDIPIPREKVFNKHWEKNMMSSMLFGVYAAVISK